MPLCLSPTGSWSTSNAWSAITWPRSRTDAGGLSDNQRLIDAIRQVRTASLRALWTDSADAFPDEGEGVLWWEVWLPVRKDRVKVIDSFRRLAAAQEMQTAPGELRFPERSVLLVRATLAQMERSVLTLNSIAELRRPKETAEFFDSLQPEEQREWLDDLLARTRFAPDANEGAACLSSRYWSQPGARSSLAGVVGSGPPYRRAGMGN